MKANVGSPDKIIRIVLGVALIGWGIYAKNWWGAIGIIPLLTALMNFCPLYSVCGMRTNSEKPAT